MFPKNNPFHNLLCAALIPIQQVFGLGHTPRPTSHSPTPAPYPLHPSAQPSTSTSLVPTGKPTPQSVRPTRQPARPTLAPQNQTYVPTPSSHNTSWPTALTIAPTAGAAIASGFWSLENILVATAGGLGALAAMGAVACCIHKRRKRERAKRVILDQPEFDGPYHEYEGLARDVIQNRFSVDSNDSDEDPLPPSSDNYFSDDDAFDPTPLGNRVPHADLMQTLMIAARPDRPVKDLTRLKTLLMQFMHKTAEPEDPNLREILTKEIEQKVEEDEEIGHMLLKAFQESQRYCDRFYFSLDRYLDKIPVYCLMLLISIIGAGAYFRGAYITFKDMNFPDPFRTALSIFAMLVGGFINAATVQVPSYFIATEQPLRENELFGTQLTQSILNECVENGALNAKGYAVLRMLEPLIRHRNITTRCNKGCASTPVLTVVAASSATLAASAFWDPAAPLAILAAVLTFVANFMSTYLGVRGVMTLRSTFEHECRQEFDKSCARCGKYTWFIGILLNVLIYIVAFQVLVTYVTPVASGLKTMLPEYIKQSVGTLFYGFFGSCNYPTYQQTIVACHAFATSCMTFIRMRTSPKNKGKFLAQLICGTLSTIVVALVNRGNAKDQMQIASFDMIEAFSNLNITDPNVEQRVGIASEFVGGFSATVEGITGIFATTSLVETAVRLFEHRPQCYKCRRCKKPHQRQRSNSLSSNSSEESSSSYSYADFDYNEHAIN